MQAEQSKSVNSTVVVVGATSMIGQHLITALLEEDYEVIAVSRQKHRDSQDDVLWYQSREEDDFSSLPMATMLIHLAPLWILPENLENYVERGVQRVVAFSSTSRFSKKDSPILAEREVAGRLELAEHQLTNRCKHFNIDLTILRPTLVYELNKDQNITTIVKFIQRFGFFCIIDDAKGLRQPVSAKDLALASTTVLDNKHTYGKTYNLAGNPTLSYKEMVQEVFQALSKKERIVSVPLTLIQIILPIVKLLPRYMHLNIEMFKRMNQDLDYDSQDAVNDFGYKPQKFSEVLSHALAEIELR